jgi:hypothetical protein
MAKSQLTSNEQVRRLSLRHQAVYRKLCRLAPADALEYEGTTDATLLTWQRTLWAVSNSADCLNDLAEDSIIDELVHVKVEAISKSPAATEQPSSFLDIGSAVRSR